MYSQTYINLCHGTDKESASMIKKKGFEIRGRKDSWCGKGVYFYDIKKKAWWAAERKCEEIKKATGRKVKAAVVYADIVDIMDSDIFDLRVRNDLCEFEKKISGVLGEYQIEVSNIEDEIERIIFLRALLISYYADISKKKMVIGNFKQRPRKDDAHIIDFMNDLEMVFGIETIYCVKDISIISNIR